MKKLRDRLNKKGFTLVELIVVIVIILILAAALIPNVMRYIDESRKASFKSDASSYLVEVQGVTAECYGKYDTDLTKDAINGKTKGQTIETVTPNIDFERPLSSIETFVGYAAATGTTGITVTTDDTGATAFTIKAANTSAAGSDKTKSLEAVISEGAVLKFAYADSQHFIQWSQADGWSDIDKEL